MESTELMVIPFQVSPTEYVLLIVMGDGNVARIKEYDPMEIPIKKMPELVVKGLALRDVVVAYATDREQRQILDNQQCGGPLKNVLELLHRGCKFRPECGGTRTPPPSCTCRPGEDKPMNNEQAKAAMKRWPQIGRAIDMEETIRFLGDWAGANPPGADWMKRMKKALMDHLKSKLGEVSREELADAVVETFASVLLECLIKQLPEQECDHAAN